MAEVRETLNRGIFGGGPLHSVWDIEEAKLLIQNGADVNARNIFGSTPLHTASKKGFKDGYLESKYLEIIQFLIEAGADVNARDDEGSTPLHGTILLNERLANAKLLIQNGADVNARNNDGEVPLHSASRIGRLEKVQFLIEAGADVKVSGGMNTNLCAAHKYKNKAIIELLKENGATTGRFCSYD